MILSAKQQLQVYRAVTPIGAAARFGYFYKLFCRAASCVAAVKRENLLRTQSGKAYAKINLTLDIAGLRPDGYHEIQTIMHTVSLCDIVTVKPARRTGVLLRCNLPYVPCDQRNIAYRAALLFFEALGRRGAVFIDLRKRIPVGAGMAGGSADAAAVLRLLNQAHGRPFSLEKLKAIGLELGADVPFCLEGGCRLARGIGEILSPAPPLPDCALAVVKPKFSISTKKLYEEIDQAPIQGRPDAPAMLEALSQGDLPRIGGLLANVMEAAALPQRPQIEEIRQALLAAGALGARMTGSGSAVYGIFAHESQARAALKTLPFPGIQTWVARPVC